MVRRKGKRIEQGEGGREKEREIETEKRERQRRVNRAGDNTYRLRKEKEGGKAEGEKKEKERERRKICETAAAEESPRTRPHASRQPAARIHSREKREREGGRTKREQ